MVKHRNPVMSFSELTVPLPASRLLWLAPSAQAWKSQYLALSPQPIQHTLSLKTMLADDATVRQLPSSIDQSVALFAYAHGLAAQIWDHAKQDTLSSDANDAVSQLWLQSRHQKLYVFGTQHPLRYLFCLWIFTSQISNSMQISANPESPSIQ